MPSTLRRKQIIEALRNGVVPSRGLELFATGLEPYEKAIDDELALVAAGQGKFKAVRGEYGTGKTFFSRWLEHRARSRKFATTLVQISETETPLYKLETVYRRALEGLQTSEWATGAFRSLIERWFYDLEEEVLESGSVDGTDAEALAEAVGGLLERRLAEVSKVQPQFAAALRACHRARITGDAAVAEGLIAWLMGVPQVAAGIKRVAGVKGDIDNDTAAGFLRGLLEVLRQTGRPGLVLVLDEVETIQRVRTDSREKSLNALRTLIDAIGDNTYPGLYILITGTPAFFDGPRGVQRAPALAMRLPWRPTPGFINAKAVQIGLEPFSVEKMTEVGIKVRDIYPSDVEDRITARVTDAIVARLARGVAGKLGGKVGIAPRIFLMRLIDLIDLVDQHETYDPETYDAVVEPSEMTNEERAAADIERTVDDIELDLEGKDT
jgi:hypothetical protein